MNMPKLISATYHPNIEVAEFICDDGRHLLRSGGTLPWRINNPGDLTARMEGGVAAPKKAKGYIGFATTRSARTFLIFPDVDSGRAELKANLKRMHGELTIPQAIPFYAPKKENDTEKYIADLLRTSGIGADKKIKDFSESDLQKTMDSIAEIEGYHASTATRKETWVTVSTINATNGIQPLPDTEIVLQIGDKQKTVKSDATGRFAPVIHPADKSAVHVKVADSKTKELVTVGKIQGDVGRDVNLVAKFDKWKGVAGSEKINSASLNSKSQIRYVVQPGDSLWKIAKLHRTSTAAIMNTNDLSDDRIFPGEVLFIGGNENEKSINAHGKSEASMPKATPGISTQAPRKRPVPATPPKPPAPSSTQPSNSVRSKEGTGKVLALINPSPGRAPWMPIAIAEAKFRGGETELTLQEKINYHVEIDDGLKSLYESNNAWCAAFVNWCLAQANYPIENASYPNRKIAKARAHGFYEVSGPKDKKESAYPTIRNPLFVELDKPIYGAIAMVTSRSNHGNHVGFVYARTGSKELVVLGGNQNQRINFSPFDISLSAPHTEKDKNGKTTRHKGSRTYLRYFIPISYYEQAKKDLANDGLEHANADETNKAMGIKNEKPKNKPIPLL
ncbi:LysM peptidoglycan-binding domain-containing protein [Variovorax sp. H27-G14]|uniref:LysM peptidoglycan-binding domain-containing protein n=1 Tax=Variovorax sp. H27-G14 TaxID=3111914 RepID=UPI0038FD3CFE